MMDIDDVVDNISLDVKARVVNTVGYSEAENKASYLSGVNTACVFMGEYAKDFLKVIIQVKAEKTEVENDIKTLVAILGKYSND